MVTNFIIFYIAKIVFFTLQSEFLNIFYFQKLKTSKTIVFVAFPFTLSTTIKHNILLYIDYAEIQ